MKKVKILLGVVVFSGAILFNAGLKQTESSQKLNLKSFFAEALAGAEGCTTTPGSNTGACKKNVNGKEWNCVTPGFWDSKDCSDD